MTTCRVLISRMLISFLDKCKIMPYANRGSTYIIVLFEAKSVNCSFFRLSLQRMYS